jgi:hypothetical protein
MDDMRELQPLYDRLLLIPAREITTFHGHANVFGLTDFLDFRVGSATVPTVTTLLKEVRNQHGLFSINHPGAPTGARCMGCGWDAQNTDYALVDSIEIVNGGSADGPYSGIPFWQDKLNKGFRITGVGGSDNHDADLPPGTGSAIGHPTTVVYAKDLSENAILDGIRAGHVFVDVDGTRDRMLTVSAQANGHTAMMGDQLSAPSGTVVHFVARLQFLKGAHIQVTRDGEVQTDANSAPLATSDEVRDYSYTSNGAPHWLRIDVRSPEGKLLLAGNPIYLK